jgi:Glycoside hydrolase family 5 C-terminal domain
MKFDRVTGLFDYTFEADPAAARPTEIFVPRLHYARGCEIEVIGGVADLDLDNQRATIKIEQPGEVRVVICRRA